MKTESKILSGWVAVILFKVLHTLVKNGTILGLELLQAFFWGGGGLYQDVMLQQKNQFYFYFLNIFFWTDLTRADYPLCLILTERERMRERKKCQCEILLPYFDFQLLLLRKAFLFISSFPNFVNVKLKLMVFISRQYNG